MMFQLDMAFATELIALSAGVALLAWINHQQIKCVTTKIVGFFIVIASILSMLCTLYYGIRYRMEGAFVHPSLKMEMPMNQNK